MSRPDFAHTDCTALAHDDIRFLIEQFPGPASDFEAFAGLLDTLPSTIESMLDSAFVYRKVLDPDLGILHISPFLFFNVLLRHELTGRRSREERHVINYLANLLSLFASGDRAHRLQQGERKRFEYLVDLVEEAASSPSERQFLVHSHIGNYALYLTGLRRHWIDYRHRYRRRPVSYRYYRDMGRAYYDRASSHPLAREYGVQHVFGELASTFDTYTRALHRVGGDCFLR